MPVSGGAGVGAYAIGCDIGVTDVKTIAVRWDGYVILRDLAKTHAASPEWAEAVKQKILQIEGKLGGSPHVGVAAPGIAAADGRSIFWMQGRLDEVQGLDWAALLRRGRVPVLNDAQAALAGEAWLGAAKGSRNVALLTLGTGVGGAVMVLAGELEPPRKRVAADDGGAEGPFFH